MKSRGLEVVRNKRTEFCVTETRIDVVLIPIDMNLRDVSKTWENVLVEARTCLGLEHP